METLINKNIGPADIKFLVKVGNKISACRKAQRISRARLSVLTGVSYGRLTKIELGRIDVDILTLSLLSNALKVNAKEFMP